MPQPPVRLITYAWGKEYIDKLLTFTLGSVLAPGNLPALASSFDSTVVIVTEKRFFDYVEKHPTSKRITAICPLRLLPLDDIIGDPWQYGISLAYALFRGFAELGPAMTETYLLFLNADFVLADGCYERLLPFMRRGEPVLLAPSYCTIAERVAPILETRLDPRTRTLVMRPRELAALILEHRHNTIRAKTVNQHLCHFEYMDQSYWQVDPHTLLGHQMPISLVAMRPEVALADLSTFWDWGIVYDFCPSQRLSVLGDSDEFLMLELREEATHRDLIRMGATTPKSAASRMLGYITQYQIDAGRRPLTLHSRELPTATVDGHASLQRFVDEQIEYLTVKPKDHQNHPDWLYHKEHLRRYHEQKVRGEMQPATLESAAVRPCSAAIVGGPSAATAPELVFHRLGPWPTTAFTRKRRWLHKMAPATRPWHPMYLPYRNTARVLRKVSVEKPTNVLFVGPVESLLARIIAGFPGAHYATASISVHNADWNHAFAALPAFGVAVIELSSADLPNAKVIYEAVAGRLRGPGPVILSWVNAGDRPVDSTIEQGLVGLLTLPDSDASVTFESSQAACRAIEWARWAWATDSRAGRMPRGAALMLGAGWALFAALVHGSIRRPRLSSADCLSLTVLIDQKPMLRSAMATLHVGEGVQPEPEVVGTR